MPIYLLTAIVVGKVRVSRSEDNRTLLVVHTWALTGGALMGVSNPASGPPTRSKGRHGKTEVHLLAHRRAGVTAGGAGGRMTEENPLLTGCLAWCPISTAINTHLKHIFQSITLSNDDGNCDSPIPFTFIEHESMQK